MIKLSVIIINYNVRFFLEQCLLSVIKACENISYEIIVIDNNSIDGSREMIKDSYSQVKLISNPENIGFSKANNIGVSKANGKYLLILNPDTVIAEDTLQKIIDFAEKQENLGVLGVKMIDGSGSFLPESKRNIPTIKIATKKIIGNSENYYANYISENEVSEVEILTGAFMLLKRKIYLEVGGFDEDYFMFGEDIDLCYKILNKGYQNIYFGKSSIIHYKGESTIKDASYLKNFYGAMQIFFKKHYRENVLLNFISDVALRSMVLLKSTSKSKNIQEKNIIQNLLIVSVNKEKIKKVKNKLKPQSTIVRDVLPENCTQFDMIVFDNTHITNKKIIENISKLRLSKISKRIIPKNTSFLIGSDSSTDRGKVVQF